MRKLVPALLLIAALSTPHARAAEPEDKELQILQLQKIIAEQSLNNLRRDQLVAEYERIRANYDKLLKDIEARQKKTKPDANEEPARDWGQQ